MQQELFSSTDLQKLRRQIEGWRAGQSGRARLPLDFWAAAAALARVHGVYRVSRTLRVDYNGLQRRAAGQALAPRPTNSSGVDAATKFLQLDWDGLQGRPEVMAAGVIELSDGARRLRLETGDRPDVWLAVAEAFWGRR